MIKSASLITLPALLASLAGVSCDDHRDAPKPGAQPGGALTSPGLPQLPRQLDSEVPAPAQTAELPVAEPAEAPPWAGPFLGITSSSAGVYSERNRTPKTKIAYAQEGAIVPVHASPEVLENCRKGWYRVVSGGFVCGDDGTTNLADPRVKLGPKQPDLAAILPYTYARNAHNGTPLYRSVPSADQIEQYEPWRFKKESAAPEAAPGAAIDKPASTATEASSEAREEQQRRMAALRAAQRAMLGEEAAKKLEAEGAKLTEPPSPAAPAPGGAEDAGAPKHWWQQEKPKLNELTMEDLAAGGDEVLASRMVKGFYIAVDKQFKWQGRNWYRSTKGYVAPVDRFHQAPSPEFKGVALDDTWKLPLAWAYGPSKTRARFAIVSDKNQLQRDGSVDRLTALKLTGETREVNQRTYLQLADGYWVRAQDVRVTQPGEPPAGIGENERWLDVNLATQTVVLFAGAKPIYASLISSGKEHTQKELDHRSPSGEFRILTKHVTATMDGDGSAAGDLPYSIEGVPYVMYFHRSYALHGAFWHGNYGHRMSHGCINLAPLDAKYIFFHTDPPVTQGIHGAWANDDRPGSRVVVHY